MARSKSQVRLERLAAERAALAQSRRTVPFFMMVTRATAEAVEAERKLYAIAPSRSEVLRQLIFEGMLFRKMHRPAPPRPAKGLPLPPELAARLAAK
jgi:hypothetical protein